MAGPGAEGPRWCKAGSLPWALGQGCVPAVPGGPAVLRGLPMPVGHGACAVYGARYARRARRGVCAALGEPDGLDALVTLAALGALL